MKNFLILSDYCKKIDGYMQEISRLAQCTGGIQTELSSSLEAMQNSIGGEISILFMESSLQFFVRLLFILLSKENTGDADPYERDRMFKIRHYIQVNFDRSINEKKVADFIGMSTSHFSRYFNKMFQCSFVEYLMQSRVNEIAKLLISTNLRIIEICDRSGFNSPSQFNRAFKQLMKMSPSEYRDRQKKE